MSYGSRGFGLTYALTPVVKRLIIANVVVFFAGMLIDALLGDGSFFQWFAFHPGRFLTKPWGVLTYMFVHDGFWHILLNMLVLFFFGPPLEALWGGRHFIKYYLVCGLGGVALSFAFSQAGLVGASAAMYGLMLAFAMNWPTAPIYVWGIFPVQARWLVAFLFVVSLLSAFGDPGMGGGVSHLAHLGGLAAGFAFLKLDWRPAAKLDRLKRATRVRRLAIVPRDEGEEEAQRAPSTGSSWTRVDERRLLDAVDRVLDKISAEGMSSLTSEERRLLDEVSRRHRTN